MFALFGCFWAECHFILHEAVVQQSSKFTLNSFFTKRAQLVILFILYVYIYTAINSFSSCFFFLKRCNACAMTTSLSKSTRKEINNPMKSIQKIHTLYALYFRYLENNKNLQYTLNRSLRCTFLNCGLLWHTGQVEWLTAHNKSLAAYRCVLIGQHIQYNCLLDLMKMQLRSTSSLL